MEAEIEVEKNRIYDKTHEYVVNGVIDEKQLVGKWCLEYEITNSLKSNGFGSVTLEPYMHPKTRLWQYPVVDGQPKAIVEITSAKTIYRPDEDMNHKSLVNWMLNHPRVRIDGMDLEPSIEKSKEGNAKYYLYNMDLRDLSEYEEENTIDEMVGRITLNMGASSISLEKTRYILARLNEPFKDGRSITNSKTEKLILKNKLKAFVKKSKENAIMVKSILSDLENAKKYYCVKVLVDSGDIKISNGMLKYGVVVLGVNVDSAVNYLETDQNTYLELQSKVAKLVQFANEE